MSAFALLTSVLLAACGGGGSGGGPSMTYTVGASITGLSANGLSLALNGTASEVPANSTSYTLQPALQTGSSYSVTVATQPTGEVCSVANGSGTIGSAAVQVTVTCGATYTISGTVTGLLGTGLVLANGMDTVTLPANASSFILPTALSSGATYSVVAKGQPASQSCAITNGSGSIASSSVTNVKVSCAVWVWAFGSKTPVAGVYGTQGVPAASNVPGARGAAASWTDATGILWMFGGSGYDAYGMDGYLNDLWSFDPKIQLWTWVSGSTQDGANGIYGTLGVAAAGNSPGARQFAVTWTSPSGDLWLFGGFGRDSIGSQGELGDLWKFTPSTGLWTWVAGSQSNGTVGTYGSKGVASTTNAPPSRDSANAWTDKNGALWLFGGTGIFSPDLTGLLNDLWKFDTTSMQWTWVAGSSSANQDGIYGTEGIAAAANVPGCRSSASSWIDAQGRFWLFGGNGFDKSAAANLFTANILNDTWMFDPTSSQWTWVAGSDTSQAIGNYVAGGLPGTPGSRQYAASWVDPAGIAWMFGGIGRDSTGNGGGLNDLWKFDATSNSWIWVSGSTTANASNNYGTQGTRGISNTPGARYAVIPWSDSSGNLWLFGGFGVVTTPSYYSDIWEFAYP
jgi:N-acetylneuraminic acid mutarotase